MKKNSAGLPTTVNTHREEKSKNILVRWQNWVSRDTRVPTSIWSSWTCEWAYYYAPESLFTIISSPSKPPDIAGSGLTETLTGICLEMTENLQAYDVLNPSQIPEDQTLLTEVLSIFTTQLRIMTELEMAHIARSMSREENEGSSEGMNSFSWPQVKAPRWLAAFLTVIVVYLSFFLELFENMHTTFIHPS